MAVRRWQRDVHALLFLCTSSLNGNVWGDNVSRSTSSTNSQIFNEVSPLRFSDVQRSLASVSSQTADDSHTPVGALLMQEDLSSRALPSGSARLDTCKACYNELTILGELDDRGHFNPSDWHSIFVKLMHMQIFKPTLSKELSRRSPAWEVTPEQVRLGLPNCDLRAMLAVSGADARTMNVYNWYDVFEIVDADSNFRVTLQELKANGIEPYDCGGSSESTPSSSESTPKHKEPAHPSHCTDQCQQLKKAAGLPKSTECKDGPAKSVAIVVDVSGSMGGASRIDRARKEVEQFITKHMDDKDFLSFITFNHDLDTILEREAIAGNRHTLNAQAQAAMTRASGTTNLYGAMVEAEKVLETSPPNHEQVIFLLSDGAHTSYTTTLKKSDVQARLTQSAGKPMVMAIGLGVSGGGVAQDLEDFASWTSGKFVKAADSVKALTDAFEEISKEICNSCTSFCQDHDECSNYISDTCKVPWQPDRCKIPSCSGCSACRTQR